MLAAGNGHAVGGGDRAPVFRPPQLDKAGRTYFDELSLPYLTIDADGCSAGSIRL